MFVQMKVNNNNQHCPFPLDVQLQESNKTIISYNESGPVLYTLEFQKDITK